MSKIKDIIKLTGIPVLVASLCCLSPLILVLVGVSTATFAASLSDTLYGEYRWAFRAAGLLMLIIALIYYFFKRGVCTLDEAKRRRNEIINTVAIVLIVAVLAYIIWLYVIVHYAGVWFKIWV